MRERSEPRPRPPRPPRPPLPFPPGVRALLERAAQLLELGLGNCRFEVMLQDGEVTCVWRHEKVPATALHRYNASLAEL